MNEKHSIRLLKQTRHVNGKRYDNLFLQIDMGNPVAIQLARFSMPLKNFLLAIAEDCEIRQVVFVAGDDHRPQKPDATLEEVSLELPRDKGKAKEKKNG